MLIVAVDIGGTFTDIVYVRSDGSLGYLKILSTPREPEKAVIEGLKHIGRVESVVHATTIATNVLRGQVGLEIPKTALVTTRGFRDVIEIGRQNRPRLYDPFFEKPKPLVPRELRFEVDERVDSRGSVIKRVDLRELEEIGEKLSRGSVVSVAISFLHSYLNPVNEAIAEEVLSKYVRYVSVSHKIAPEPREYERTSTTVVNAVLMPIVSRYLEKLASSLKELGVKELSIMSSSGGLVSLEEAASRPVQIIESGPAAGVVASAVFAKFLGKSRVISFDMGGTTAKAGTVVNYEVVVTSEYEVGGETHYGRIVKGSGYPVRFPFVDLAEVSAGGGTIIWRDEAGALHVGPMSAGADPGPVCYGRGGIQPTITDANLVLGRLGDSLAGGVIKLDKNASINALAKLGDPVDVSWRAIELANLEMARAIRLVTIERGLDPREFTLIAFGGAGPQHAVEIASELDIREVVIPPQPGLFSALGLLLADWKFEARSSYPDPDRIEEEYSKLEEELLKKIGRVSYFARYADVRYEGQGWELTVPVSKPATLESIRRVFEEKHRATYGFTLDREIEIVVIRVFAVVEKPKPKLPKPPASGTAKPRSHRRVLFSGEWINTPVYWRDDLPTGFRTEGPLVVEEYSSTTVVPPGWVLLVGEYGELRIRRVD
ncbi:MAG: hydantoinase/oxoprolinase family protein [Thermoprotei archaeon]